MKKVATIMGVFDQERYAKLKRNYNKAIKANAAIFTEDFNGQVIEWDISFTKYMIEYLDSQFLQHNKQ